MTKGLPRAERIATPGLVPVVRLPVMVVKSKPPVPRKIRAWKRVAAVATAVTIIVGIVEYIHHYE